jgi:hypothetical protein
MVATADGDVGRSKRCGRLDDLKRVPRLEAIAIEALPLLLLVQLLLSCHLFLDTFPYPRHNLDSVVVWYRMFDHLVGLDLLQVAQELDIGLEELAATPERERDLTQLSVPEDA